MDTNLMRDFCLSKAGTEEDQPFGEQTTVFKVGGKVFALCGTYDFTFVNLKCDPLRAIELREQYPEAVRPGYHMNKKHWNSVYPNAELNTKEILELVTHSYDCVFKTLTAKLRREIAELS